MTKKEFIDRYDDFKKPIIKEYGLMAELFVSNILNLNHIQDQLETLGYRIERRK